MFIKHQDDKLSFCGTTMDDCLFLCTNKEERIQNQIQMLKNKYEDVTIEKENELGLIGMQVVMDHQQKHIILTQPKQMARIIESFQDNRGAPNPALMKLMSDDGDDRLLQDQSDYISKCAMLMFLSQRTYPEYPHRN